MNVLAHALEAAARDHEGEEHCPRPRLPGGDAAGAGELARRSGASIRQSRSCARERRWPVQPLTGLRPREEHHHDAVRRRSARSALSRCISTSRRIVDKAGVTPSFIYAGARKIDGNLLQPFAKEDRDAIQAEVDKYLDLFIQRRRRRSRLSPHDDRRRAQPKRQSFIGEDAVNAGLADTLGTFDDALERRATRWRRRDVLQRPVAKSRCSASCHPPRRPKPDVAAGNHGWDDIVAKVNARQAQPKPASTSSVSKEEVATAFARAAAKARGEPYDKPPIGHGWDEVIEKMNARHARERGIRK